jgi:hypothetical protein
LFKEEVLIQKREGKKQERMVEEKMKGKVMG